MWHYPFNPDKRRRYCYLDDIANVTFIYSFYIRQSAAFTITFRIKDVKVPYNRAAAALRAIEISRANFEGTFFPFGSGNLTASAAGSVGGFFTYPTTILDHVTNTGSAIFISEAMYAGNFPLTWGVDSNGNPVTGICDTSGFAEGGWRVCLGDSVGATNSWRGHSQLRSYLVSTYVGGSSVGSLPYANVSPHVDYTDHGKVTNAQALYDLFDTGGAFAAVDTGDYIFLDQGGSVRHGFLIVGWGLAVDAPAALNARVDSESGTGRVLITTTKTNMRVPYVADFAYGYDGTNTGWLQDVRPRPFYATALRINSEDVDDIISSAVMGELTDYQARIRGGAFNPFIFDGNPNAFPNWEFIHLPTEIQRSFDFLHCPL